MKIMIAILMMVSTNVFAASKATQVWDCSGTSDPDYVNVDVYEAKGHLFARISQYYGDGDGFALDVVEIEQIDNGNDAIVTYQQMENSGAKPVGVPEASHATGKSHGARLNLPFLGGEAELTMTVLPNGDHSQGAYPESLDCTRK